MKQLFLVSLMHMERWELKLLKSETEIAAGFALMRQLRPQLDDLTSFARQLARQSGQGYRLSGLWLDQGLAGLIGFRESENFLYGRFIYVDDLVVDGAQRSSGLGAKLLDYARNEGKLMGCEHLVLDTGLQKPLAQRFYFREGLLARGMHFVQQL